MTNYLHNALSPYLLQHKDNPVNWYRWGDAAFAEAKKHDRPIFLSIGYAACHWCHVMAHESFEDPTIAEYLNQHFVAIKVDREERPDIDQVYMKALVSIQGHGGWPLSMFLLPDGRPFFGGTYFPNTPRYGSVSFMQVLKHIRNLWQNYRHDVLAYSQELTQALQQDTIKDTTNIAQLTEKTFLQEQAEEALLLADDVEGGLQGAPKFPQIPLWQWLINLAEQTDNHQLKPITILTATKLCRGGIYDHVGGGWMRYSTDKKWLVPHFEKMLYDNALIIQWLSSLAAYDSDNLFYRRIKQTIDWLQTDMLLPEGLFASSIDADSEGVEGKFYVWDYNEIKKLLGDNTAEFCQAYDITPTGNWEGKNILHQNHPHFKRDDEVKFSAITQRLAEYRANRVKPERDDKALTDWNALLVTALARAGLVYSQPSWVDLAQNTFTALENHLSHQGIWYHCYRNGNFAHPGFLEDYAFMIQAATELYCITHDNDYLEKAENSLSRVEALFLDNDAQLFKQFNITENQLITNHLTVQDNVVPSGNGMMLLNYINLWLLTEKPDYANKFEKIANNLPKQNARSTLFSSYINLAALRFNDPHTVKGPFSLLSSPAKHKLLAQLGTMTYWLNKPDLKDFDICFNRQCQRIKLNEL